MEATPHGAGPWDPTMLHGGAPTALIVRLLEDQPSDVPMQLTRLTVDLKRPVPVGTLDIDLKVTREGRNIQTFDVTLTSNGKEVTRASALKIRSKAFDLPEDATLPSNAFILPEAKETGLRAVGFNSTVDMRDGGAHPTNGTQSVWFRIERPFFEDRETTPLMRAAATGDYCNGTGSPLDFEQWTFLNADLTVHFSRPPVGEWMMLAAKSWIGPDGRGLAFGELADHQGFFGRATQSLVIAKR
ncbi:MAG: thioesterase family protein [Pseudomonadota bacterium]